MKVSVVVPCFNAEKWIVETLTSVRGQGIADLETLVIDDGSTDRSAELVLSNFPEMRLVRMDRQEGAAQARNVGIGLSRGMYIQFLDADDLLAPGKLRAQFEALERSGADIAYGDWQRLEALGGTGRFERTRIMARRLSERPEVDLFEAFWCPPAAYLFRRTIVEKAGGFKQRFPVIQDARFVLDCALAGARFVHCEGIAAYYRVHCSGSLSTRSTQAFLRDLFNNTSDMETLWTSGGGSLGPEQTRVLITHYASIGRSSYEHDRDLFEECYRALQRLRPGYLPSAPFAFALAARVLGHRKAEAVALGFRRLKRRVGAR